MRPKCRRHLPALLAATALVLITAACGGPDDGGSGTATVANAGQNPMSAYAACMKENGVQLNLPTARPSRFPFDRPTARPSIRPTDRFGIRPSGAPGGFPRLFGKPADVDDAVWQKALQACESVRPSFGPGGRNGQGGRNGRGGPAGGNGSLTAYQNCLKDHGVQAPDRIDPADPAAAAGLATCKVLSPSPAS